MQVLLSIFIIIIQMQNGFSQEDQCSINRKMATCVHIKDCPSALRDIKERKHPQLCGFQGINPIVCCSGPEPNHLNKIRIHMEKVQNTTANKITEVIIDLSKYNGTKAKKQCLEYQKLTYVCREPVVDDKCVKVNRCFDEELHIVGGGGEDAARLEFPHMVLLGYGQHVNNLTWQCGGTLISENFILTAGHCSSTFEREPVSYAALGLLKRSDPMEYWKIYKIKRVIAYPKYKAPHKYHDIALLETETPVELDHTMKPGCLHVGDEVEGTTVWATGWGALGPTLDNANTLQKIPLQKVSGEKCSLNFPPFRNMAQGYDHNTQMCYGDDGIPRDTCFGDSGGPLQTSHKLYCMYDILGVTSFGRSCLRLGRPGMYTRVSYYVPWIESIVWP